MKENENKYEVIFNSNLDMVYIHDLNGRFIDANKVALQKLGYGKDEIKSLYFEDLLEPEDIGKARKVLTEIKQYQFQKKISLYKIKTKYGSFIYVETTGIFFVVDCCIGRCLGKTESIVSQHLL